MYELEDVRKIYAYLTYKQHGGSGLNWRPGDVDRLDLEEVQWYIDWLTDQRKREAAQLERSARKK